MTNTVIPARPACVCRSFYEQATACPVHGEPAPDLRDPRVRWITAAAVQVGETTADRGTLLAAPVPVGDGMARFSFAIGDRVLPLMCTLPVVRY